jgi:P4 family phage/plasmid primase-like protien
MKEFNEKYKKYLNIFGSSAHSKTLIEFFTDKVTDNDFINKCNFNNTHLLPLRNMNLNLKTLELEERTQEQYFTKIVNIDEKLFRYYKADSDSIYNNIDLEEFNTNYNKVDDFFLQIANGNKEKKNYLKQMLGYFITGEVKTRSFFVWYGDGSNGKSAVMNLLKVILGDYYKATNPGLIIMKGDSKASDASPQMECLDYGSRLCVLSETKKKDKLNEDVIKNITGGDVISYRPLYGGEKNIKSEAKLVLLTNNKPTFNMTKPMLKRLRYFLFSASFSEDPKKGEYLANPDLCDELLTTLINYVLLWIAEGAEQYYMNDCKLTIPSCMIDENESLLSDMDTYKLFKTKELIKTDNKKDKILQSVAYAKYIENLSGKGAVLDKFEFFDLMENDFGKTHRIGGREYYINVKFNEGVDEEAEFNDLDV